MTLDMRPVAFVRSPRTTPDDDDWGDVLSVVELADDVPDASLDGIDAFSHVEVLYYFDRVAESAVATGSRHPRGNADWPKVGIFAQRGKDRPNRIGSTIVEIVRLEPRRLHVRGLDAIDGTPVLDLKPVMREFLPRSPVRQPEWASAIMRNYWRRPGQSA